MKCDAVKWLPVLTWVLRVSVGGIFVFSGFVKAIDTWGTLYKVNDYLNVLSLHLWSNLVLVGVFSLCAIEFLTGVFLLLGCFRRSTAIMGGCVMAVMLPLSLWIALSNPVADCGCFGDALVISNWATLWKNVFLSGGMIWLIRYNHKTCCLITPALQCFFLMISVLFIFMIEITGYSSQPLIDFRSYKIGEYLVEFDSDNDDGPQYVFIYEKGGIREEFDVDDEMPDESDGWTFIDRREVNEGKGSESGMETYPSKNLRIWSIDGEDDETMAAIVPNGKELIVMMPDLKEVSPSTIWKLNSFYEWSLKNEMAMIAVVSGSREEIDSWIDLSMASYPVYIADDTQIKEVVRGNPGVVYIEDGIIKWKSSLSAIEVDDFLLPDAYFDAKSFATDGQRVLCRYLYMYLVLTGVLTVLSFTPKLRHIFKSIRHNRSI